MNCSDFASRMQAVLDNRQLPEDDLALRRHAAECIPCREALALQSILFREVIRTRKLVRGTTTGGGTTVRRNSRPESRRTAWLGAAAAAATLFLVIPAWRIAREAATPAKQSHRFASLEPVASVPALWVNGEPPQSVSAVARPERPSVPANTSLAKVHPDQEAVGRLMESVASTFASEPASPFEPLQDIAGGIRPLSNTLNNAWTVLIQSIPDDPGSLPVQAPELLNWLRWVPADV